MYSPFLDDFTFIPGRSYVRTRATVSFPLLLSHGRVPRDCRAGHLSTDPPLLQAPALQAVHRPFAESAAVLAAHTPDQQAGPAADMATASHESGVNQLHDK